MTPTLTQTTSLAPFTAADRCDRCQAQGKVRVVLAGGGELVFCGHHARVYDARLREVAVEVVTSDENDD